MTERQHSGLRQRRPDFMLVGSMKSGTTTLYQFLRDHPRVFMCKNKEPMFFSRDEKYSQGFDWYYSLFGEARDDQLCGEASVCYSRWPYFGDVVGRIHNALPDLKFLYSMRHPVERAYSHYRHLMEERRAHDQGELLTFEQALEECGEIFDTGLYRMQIEKFLERFPRERFLLLFFEEMNAEPVRVFSAVQSFLQIDGTPVAENPSKSNPFGTKIAQSSMEHVVDSVRSAPGIAFARRFIPGAIRARLRKGLTSTAFSRFAMRRRIKRLGDQLSPLDDETRRVLLERYEGPNRELEKFLGRPVPDNWWC